MGAVLMTGILSLARSMHLCLRHTVQMHTACLAAGLPHCIARFRFRAKRRFTLCLHLRQYLLMRRLSCLTRLVHPADLFKHAFDMPLAAHAVAAFFLFLFTAHG